MRITSKFPGRCKRCGESYLVGEMVDWTPGYGCDCAICAGGKIPESIKSQDRSKAIQQEQIKKFEAVVPGGISRSNNSASEFKNLKPIRKICLD